MTDPLKAEAERLAIGTELYAVLDRLQIELDSATVADLTRWLEAREQLASHRGAQEALRAAAAIAVREAETLSTGSLKESRNVDFRLGYSCACSDVADSLRDEADALAQPQETRTKDEKA